MKPSDINFIKLRSNVDVNSIEMFHACLIYNTKLQPLIELELKKWPMYLNYWNKLLKEKSISHFKIITTTDKITIVGDYLKSPVVNKNNNTVIFLLHGITNTRYWIFKQAHTFLEQGYNVVWYDARNHGESSATTTTFGQKESYDLQDVINFIEEKYHPENMIIYGFSLGSASTIMWSKLYKSHPSNKNIRMLIIDSCFSELEQSFLDQVDNHTFAPTNFMVNMFQKIIKKTTSTSDLKIFQPIKYLKYIPNLPVLFLHGKADNIINYTNTRELYNEKIRYEQSVRSKYYLVEKASHGQIFLLSEANLPIYDEFNQIQQEKSIDLILNFINQELN